MPRPYISITAAISLAVMFLSRAFAMGATEFERIVVDADPLGEPLEKAVADINGDGKGDLIVGMGGSYGPGGVYWWEFPKSGNPRDSWKKHTILSSGDCYEHMQIYDLNGDGKPDIVLSISGNMEWLQHPGGDGSGPWIRHKIATGIGHEVRLADIDGDGKMDVVTSRTRNIDFQDSPTSWTVVPWGDAAEGSGLDGMALLNIGAGKGAVNIAAATSTGIYWFENPREHGGDARKDKWIAHFIGMHDTGGPALAAMDVNGDGHIDILQAPNEGVQGKEGLIWWEAPEDRRSGKWIKHSIDSTWEAVHWIEVADMDGDGHPDFIIAEQEQAHDPPGGPYHYNNDRVAIFYGDGSGGFTKQIVATTGGQNQVAADTRGVGLLDFFYANHGFYGAPHPIELYLNLGKRAAR